MNYTVNKHTIQVNNFILGTRYGIRTHVNAVKGHDPRPLDEPSVRNRRQLEISVVIKNLSSHKELVSVYL
jgi:hypothetical protein